MMFITLSKRVRYLPLYLALVTILIGCATYQPGDAPSPITEDDILQDQVVLTMDSLEFHLAPLTNQQIAKKYLGLDPLKSNMLPVFMRVHNSGNQIVKIDISLSFLLTTSGESYPALALEQSIDRAMRSHGEVVAWTIGFGLIGALASGSQVASANRTLEEDYLAKRFKPTLINAEGSAQGIVFFDIPAEEQGNISSAVIHVLNLTTNDAKHISINLTKRNDE